jgi:transposase-like protein
MKRTKYTAEFKLEAAKQIPEKGHLTTDVANRLGVSVGLLYTWTRKTQGVRRETNRSFQSYAGRDNQTQSRV